MFAFPKNRSALLWCAAVVSCVLISLPAVATPTFYSTGTHVKDGLDLDWWVSTGYGGNFNTDNFVQAHSWVHGSETWISDTDYSVYPPTKPQDQSFTFRQSFDLTKYDPSKAALKFYWGCDDVYGPVGFTPVFSINGGAFQGSGDCTGYNIGNKLVTLTSGFVAGTNHIDFRVQGNYATNGMGLRVESFTAPSVPDSSVPEPSTMALLVGGLLALRLRARVRREA